MKAQRHLLPVGASCFRRRLFCSCSAGPPQHSSPMARGRCIATTSATPGRVRAGARCSGRKGRLTTRRSGTTSRSGTVSTSSGHRHRSAGRQDHLLRHGLQVLFDRHVRHLQHADRQRQLPPPPCRCLRLLAGSRRGRHDLHGRPRQLAERVHDRPDHQETHSQVEVQPGLQGNDGKGHEGDIWQHPVIAPAGRPDGGYYLLHPRPDQPAAGHLHRPHRQRERTRRR